MRTLRESVHEFPGTVGTDSRRRTPSNVEHATSHAGLLLGLALDWLFSTNPVFTIVGVIAGFVSGFVKLWVYSKVLEDQARERGRLG